MIKAERFTETATELQRISAERQAALIANPEGKTAAELNGQIPELNTIELHNDASPSPSSKDVLHLVAWNMERGRHWQRAAQLVAAHPALRAPDVLFLSEMDLGMARSGNLHTTREFAATLGLNYAYGVEFLELSQGEEHERASGDENGWGYHGNAILSAYPLSNVRMLRFPGIQKWYDDYQKRLGGRIALFADITVNGHTVTLVETHLESAVTDSEIRRQQGRMILDELAAHAADNPVLLGGDLNAFPSASVIRDLAAAGFAIEEGNDLSGGTMQRLKDGKVLLMGRPIDYLAVRGVAIVKDETSPQRVPTIYPLDDPGAMLGDHAAVTLKVRVAPLQEK